MTPVAAWPAGERARAVATVIFVPVALRVFPLRRTLALCDRWTRGGMHRAATPRALADRAQRWLSRGRGPWRATCLTRAIVLYTMLRQHGYRPRLSIGVRGAAAAFVAHAWVSLAGGPIADDPGVEDQYRPIFIHHG